MSESSGSGEGGKGAGLRLVWEPKVYLVGRQVVDEAALTSYIVEECGAQEWTTDAPSAAEKLIEAAGRCCYRSFATPRPGGNEAYIDHILEMRHGSVCEHAVFSFIISGVSRSLTHELVRHRAGMAYSMLSQRYVDSSDVAFIVPPAMIDNVRGFLDARSKCGMTGGHVPGDHPGLSWYVACSGSLERYDVLADHLTAKYSNLPDRTVRRKAAREAARSVLPNATETTIFVTANGRALRNVFEQRGSEGADAEIRRLAVAWLRVVKPAAPNLFADCSIVETDDGIGRIEITHSKV